MKRVLALGFVALAASCLVYAQEFRGSISGAITDASGSAVAGAKITVTQTNTGTKVESASDTSGHYNVPFLLPGDYDISAKVTGFKEYVRKAFHLGAGETPSIDIKME